MDTHERSWAAGFFDGEGYVGLRGRGPRCVSQLQISITQCDRRVLDRFAACVGGGKVYGPHTPKSRTPNQQPRYNYVAVGANLVPRIMGAIYPWLSPVKRAQYDACMTRHAAARTVALGTPGSRATCKRGHPFSTTGTQRRHGKVYVARYCKECARITMEEYRKRRFARALLSA